MFRAQVPPCNGAAKHFSTASTDSAAPPPVHDTQLQGESAPRLCIYISHSNLKLLLLLLLPIFVQPNFKEKSIWFAAALLH